MVLTQSMESGLVNAFLDVVADDKMQHLAMEHVVDVEHHLGQ